MNCLFHWELKKEFIIMISIKDIFENFLSPTKIYKMRKLLTTRPMLPFRKNIKHIKDMNSKLANMNNNKIQR